MRPERVVVDESVEAVVEESVWRANNLGELRAVQRGEGASLGSGKWTGGRFLERRRGGGGV